MLLGCAAPVKRSVPTSQTGSDATSDQNNETLQTTLLSLEKKIDLLQSQIQTVKEQQELDRLAFENRMKTNSRTLNLLELNLKEANKKIEKLTLSQSTKPTTPVPKKRDPALSPLESTKPKSGSVAQGLVKEMKIPDKSSAVEEVTLLPSEKSNQAEKIKKPKISTGLIPLSKTDKKKNAEGEPEPLNWEDRDLKPPVSPIRSKVVPGAKRRYQIAFKVFSEREYVKSIELFEDFIKRFPDDLDADNSQFWIGQAYYELADYLQAEIAFRKVLKNYGHGETKRGYKTPDAILMLGRIYIVRDMPIKATNYFNHVVKQYPKSRSAVKAKRERQALSSF